MYELIDKTPESKRQLFWAYQEDDDPDDLNEVTMDDVDDRYKFCYCKALYSVLVRAKIESLACCNVFLMLRLAYNKTIPPQSYDFIPLRYLHKFLVFGFDSLLDPNNLSTKQFNSVPLFFVELTHSRLDYLLKYNAIAVLIKSLSMCYKENDDLSSALVLSALYIVKAATNPDIRKKVIEQFVSDKCYKEVVSIGTYFASRNAKTFKNLNYIIHFMFDASLLLDSNWLVPAV